MSSNTSNRTKALNRIIVQLGFVLLFTILIQLSRSQLPLVWTFHDTAGERPAQTTPRNALTPEAWNRLDKERLLVLYEPDNPLSEKIRKNVEQILSGMKKSYESVRAGEELPNVEENAAVIITFSDLSHMGESAWLERFVAEGGHLFWAALPQVNDAFYSLSRKLGILEVGSYVEAEGLKLQTNILLGHAGESFHDPGLGNIVLQVKLTDDSRIHATVGEEMPLMWQTPYGKGSFLVFNGTMLQETSSRGLIAGGLGVLLPDSIYPVINTKVMYIDDFPAPFPMGTHPAIFQEYRLDLPQFYKKVWWPDMIRLARSHDLVYTGALIVTYDDDVSPPFDWKKEANLDNLILYGRDLLKAGGEIGVHGYNHQSLTMSKRVSYAFGYKQWAGVDEMAASLRELREYVQAAFPNYPLRTYVPPSNALGPEGRAALIRALPELKNISSLYGEDGKNLSYTQEYGIASDGIVEMPRVTYGYRIGTYDRWIMANAVTSWGVFSHFVHPDDILDPKRSGGEGWSDLYDGFAAFLDFVHDRFGWLRSMTAADASVEVERWARSKPVFERRPDGLYGYVNHFTGEMYFVMRTEKKLVRTNHCSLLRIDEGVYLVRAERETFSIEWTEG
ncbi:MAG: DUF2194 domain-containing protein [Brevibacillus sp.]|nr:DUF2194 domain-containing protein [Brevibacillus sp.]